MYDEASYTAYIERLGEISGLSEYPELLDVLSRTAYIPWDPHDINRKEDALDMRVQISNELKIPEYVFVDTIDTAPCTVLEMVTAFAIRLEHSICISFEYGEHPERLVYAMMDSLGVLEMTNEDEIYRILEKWMAHRYSPDGRGGLFYVPGSTDMLRKELWYQAQEWMNTYEQNREDC